MRLRDSIAATAWAAAAITAVIPGASAQQPSSQRWSLHGQATFVEQYHPAFRSSYSGANSLDRVSRGDETFDATLFMGARLWDGGEIYINPEIDQGFGISNTLGLAGFSSGEAYKVGKAEPYFRLQRLIFRQTFDLGGDPQTMDDAANQIGGTHTADNLIITAGKLSVSDIFDTNSYAHDPKQDFLNWAVIDSGAFDYAADAWGYSYGLTFEWTQNWWTVRGGVFDLSRVPNSTELQTDFDQFELTGEVEARQDWFGKTGKIKLLGFLNRGRMGNYSDAVRLARSNGGVPDMAAVRRYASKAGAALNIEQPISDGLGIFVRASLNDGSKEAYEFTEITRSIAAGLSLQGDRWNRPKDTVGFAVVANDLSDAARTYFAAGGMGILIGDGRLANYGREKILEAYYNARLTDWLLASTDYQFVSNPAYNRKRGPVSIVAFRLHSTF